MSFRLLYTHIFMPDDSSIFPSLVFPQQRQRQPRQRQPQTKNAQKLQNLQNKQTAAKNDIFRVEHKTKNRTKSQFCWGNKKKAKKGKARTINGHMTKHTFRVQIYVINFVLKALSWTHVLHPGRIEGFENTLFIFYFQ